MSLDQEVYTSHCEHSLVRYEKGNWLGLGGQRFQCDKPLGGRPFAQDSAVVAKPPGKVSLERLQKRALVGD